jgi:murein DD-endopeptidase MepM/ murein hydrolase activator NlpD
MTLKSVLALLCLLLMLAPAGAITAQNTCGVVDAVELPVEDINWQFDDFARFRERFGGNHLGIDLAFDRWGDPVRASMRGRVTVSNLREWGSEKGVVVLQHIMPDGAFIYSVYGHMEETDRYTFPLVDSCVEAGQVVGVIGWPSLGRPHLHYEVRRGLPNEGGPGYTQGNPLNEGWYHPLDFTFTWRARLHPAFRSVLNFDTAPTVPPVLTETGGYALGGLTALSVLGADGRPAWRVAKEGVVDGLVALPGDRLVARTREGEVFSLQSGRYLGLWQVPGADVAFAALGEVLVFPTEDGTLTAYDTLGAQLWQIPGQPGSRLAAFRWNGGRAILALAASDGLRLRQVIADGTVIAEMQLPRLDAIAPLPDMTWLLLSGEALYHWRAPDLVQIATISPPGGNGAALVYAPEGSVYIYTGGESPALVRLGPDGATRWAVPYPGGGTVPPLMAVGTGCALYTLDATGVLHVFRAEDGTAVTQLAFYVGGRRSTSVNARLLRADGAEQVTVSAGFLSLMTFDGRTLSSGACG